MGFVVPERTRPSYWALMRSLRIGTFVPAFAAVVVVQIATAGQSLPPATVALVAIPLSVPPGVWLSRKLLERRTGYVMPWWIATVGVGASWAATPWAGAWVLREILAGTFGGELLGFEPAQSTAAPAPLAYQTGLAYSAPAAPAPVGAPFVEPLPEPEVHAPLRIVAAAAPLVAAPPPPVVEEPAAAIVALPPAPAEAPPLPPEPEPAAVVAAATAFAGPPASVVAFPLPEPAAPSYEPEPEPTPVAGPTEPALAEAPPIVVEHVAPLHVLPPLEEEDVPFFLPQSDLEPAAAGDPFAAFWLDPEAPPPDGLTPGYLPPLTGMWRTPLGDKL